MKKKTQVIRYFWLALFVASLSGCAAKNRDVDSESHFLCTRDSECERVSSETRCIRGICRVPLQDGAVDTRVDAALSSTTAVGQEPPMVALASAQAMPSKIEVDGTNVYWMNLGHTTTTDTKSPQPNFDGQILTCPTGGCGAAPTVLASGFTTSAFRTAFAVGGGNVYWETENDAVGSILKCSTSGADQRPDTLITSFASALIADRTNVYWAGGGPSIELCAAGGCTARALSTSSSGDPSPQRLISDDTAVYWISVRDILRCDKTGCDGEPTIAVPRAALAQKAQPYDVAVDGTNIYWTTSDISDASNGGLGVGQVLKCAKTGCETPTVVVTGLTLPSSIATDGKNVYWSESAEASCCSGADDNSCCNGGPNIGRIARCPVTGCDAPTTIVAHQAAAWNLAVDASSVYFTTSDGIRTTGSIIRAPK
jgi:hypothetical protein